jgi:alkanesulfonate monooxygenase SsuD/methylene tetrahydromethanopterin reductase-like flavin-dependent oxidoreductase (luciferase family)
LKFGVLFHPHEPPDCSRIVDRWQETLQAAVVAEESGFDGVFIPEHHQMPDGYPPSVWGGLGALAALTERVDVGTTIMQLTLDHPIHVAEHAAMVDIIAGGRVKLGCGMAYLPEEFALFGLDKSRRGERFEECMDIVRRAWAGEELDYHSNHFDISGGISPLPIDAELWMGAMSEQGVRRAGRMGFPWVTDPLHNIAVMHYWQDSYHEAADEYGRRDQARTVLLRDGWIGDSLAAVERDWWPYVRAQHWFYFNDLPAFVREREPWMQGVTSEDDFKFDRHRIDRLVVGAAEDCIAQIEQLRDELGMDYLVMQLRMASGPSFELELECLRRFGAEVIAAFKVGADSN